MPHLPKRIEDLDELDKRLRAYLKQTYPGFLFQLSKDIGRDNSQVYRLFNGNNTMKSAYIHDALVKRINELLAQEQPPTRRAAAVAGAPSSQRKASNGREK